MSLNDSYTASVDILAVAVPTTAPATEPAAVGFPVLFRSRFIVVITTSFSMNNPLQTFCTNSNTLDKTCTPPFYIIIFKCCFVKKKLIGTKMIVDINRELAKKEKKY